MNMVASRPMWSDTQPHKGRVRPLVTRSIVSAKVSAGNVMPSRLTGTPATSKSSAIGASWAVKVRPPALTRTNMTYSSQKSGERRTSFGAKSRAAG